MRMFIEKFKKVRDKFYSCILRKPRLYFYPARYLEEYKLGMNLIAVSSYRKIRVFNFELIEFCRKPYNYRNN